MIFQTLLYVFWITLLMFVVYQVTRDMVVANRVRRENNRLAAIDKQFANDIRFARILVTKGERR